MIMLYQPARPRPGGPLGPRALAYGTAVPYARPGREPGTVARLGTYVGLSDDVLKGRKIAFARGSFDACLGLAAAGRHVVELVLLCGRSGCGCDHGLGSTADGAVALRGTRHGVNLLVRPTAAGRETARRLTGLPGVPHLSPGTVSVAAWREVATAAGPVALVTAASVSRVLVACLPDLDPGDVTRLRLARGRR